MWLPCTQVGGTPGLYLLRAVLCLVCSAFWEDVVSPAQTSFWCLDSHIYLLLDISDISNAVCPNVNCLLLKGVVILPEARASSREGTTHLSLTCHMQTIGDSVLAPGAVPAAWPSPLAWDVTTLQSV